MKKKILIAAAALAFLSLNACTILKIKKVERRADTAPAPVPEVQPS